MDMRNIFIAVALLVLGVEYVTPTYAQADPQDVRVALVIGNGDYRKMPLRNPLNDAKAIAQSLRESGFQVTEVTNLRTADIGTTLRNFRSTIPRGATALFYFAGHGVQIRGVNYLVAVDANLEYEDDVPLQAIDLNRIFEAMSEAGSNLNLVFLDACRDNPLPRTSRSTRAGLAKVDAPSGTLVSFATRPGSTASDGSGVHGLYTEHLLTQIQIANQPVELALKRVVSGVKATSKGRQEPWMEGSIEGDFYFRRAPVDPNSILNSPIPASPSGMDIREGDVYEGTFEMAKGNLVGKGVLRRHGTKVFEGTFENGKPMDGNGTIDLGAKGTYVGAVKNGMFHGEGRFTAETFAYQGELFEGRRHGQGTAVWKNGDKYTGGFADDKANGRGVWEFASGHKYEGEVANGKFSGKGRLFDPSGAIYDGDFAEGQQTGIGKWEFPNGDKYEGGVLKGLLSGKGKYVGKNGDVFEGDHSEGKRNGFGKYQFANGDSYEGEVKNGALTGKAVYTYAIGMRLEGQFLNGKIVGLGTLYTKNGSRFEGEFSDRQNAIGTLISKDGNRFPAAMVEGKIVTK